MDHSERQQSPGWRTFWLLFKVFLLPLAYIVTMASLPFRACIDGSPWHGQDCFFARRGLGDAIVVYNMRNEVPIATFSPGLPEMLVKGKYFEETSFQIEDPELVVCPGGWMPDPPNEAQRWWYDKELNLFFNGYVPLPLTRVFGGVRDEPPGTFSVSVIASGVLVTCSLHGKTGLSPYQPPYRMSLQDWNRLQKRRQETSGTPAVATSPVPAGTSGGGVDGSR